ncbi:MAG: UbiA family prenyltransferase [Nitrososphaeria archaeon]
MDRDVLRLLRKARTMNISVCDENGPWVIKVYYAMDRGFIFLLEKDGRTLNAILKDPKASFSIDLNRPDLFVQGSGTVEILGDPAAHDRERGALLSKIPEDALFINLGHVVLARLVPDRMRVTDMRGEPRKYYVQVRPEELADRRPMPVIRALRPWSFQMSVSAMIIGVLLVRRIVVPLFLLALLGILLAHGAFNALSDYFDFRSSVDTPTGMGSVGSRALVDGLWSPASHMAYSLALLLGSVVIGTYLTLLRPSILPFFLIGLLAGVLYGIPRIGLKWLALGDLGVMLAFGPGIVLGTETLMGARVDVSSVLVSVAIGMVIVAVLHANNWRDVDDDRRAGVVTLASLLGETGSRIYYLSLIWLSYLLFVVAVVLNHSYWPILGSFLTVPWALRLTRIAMNPRDWNRRILDQRTGFFTALHMYFSIAFLLLALLLHL